MDLLGRKEQHAPTPELYNRDVSACAPRQSEEEMTAHSCLEDSSVRGQKVTTENEAQDDTVKVKHLSQRDCLKDAIDLPAWLPQPSFSLHSQRSGWAVLPRGRR